MPQSQRQPPRTARASVAKRATADRAASTPDGEPTGGPKKPSPAARQGGPTPKKESSR
jgi:hypothetical protein